MLIRKNKNILPDKLDCLSSKYIIQPKNLRKKIKDIIKDIINNNLLCPMCGAELDNGDKFILFMENINGQFSIGKIKSQNIQSIQIEDIHIESLNVVIIKCNECGYCQYKEKFLKHEDNIIIVKILKINKEWTLVSSNNKKFYIKSILLPSIIKENDSANIVGMDISEIYDGIKINSKFIALRPI